jgi:sec-independent protein translocase protein TatA
MFGNLGATEIIFIMVIVLLVFGAKRLPEIGQSLGKGIREFKKSMSDISGELNQPQQPPQYVPPQQPQQYAQPMPPQQYMQPVAPPAAAQVPPAQAAPGQPVPPAGPSGEPPQA